MPQADVHVPAVSVQSVAELMVVAKSPSARRSACAGEPIPISAAVPSATAATLHVQFRIQCLPLIEPTPRYFELVIRNFRASQQNQRLNNRDSNICKDF